jgi:ribosomal 30S subunit maturation factor RimM
VKRVDVGRVIKPHGLRGQVVVGGVRLALEEFRALGHVYAKGVAGTTGPAAAVRRLEIKDVKAFMHNLIVRFEGFDAREHAEEIHGAVLEVDPAQLPENEEGTVYQTGATPVLVVHGPPAAEGGKPRERMLPMSAEVLVRVDTAGGRITVRLLPGMEELG